MDFDMGEVCAQRFSITHLIDVKLELRLEKLGERKREHKDALSR